MVLTDWFKWPVLSQDQARRNALLATVETARYRRDADEAARFVAEANRRRSRA
jgi:hypothetical protein